MTTYYHAHKVLHEKCDARMKCVRACPTQAIRIRNNKSCFDEELCVDCGACLSECPKNAIVPITDPMSNFDHFKYKVVVPAAVLYSQFDSSIHPYIIRLALNKIGFDKVVDLNVSTKVLAFALTKYLGSYKGRRPLIASHCPAAIRLIQVKYPDLVEMISPLDVPREVTAREIRKNLPQEIGLKSEDIGIIYLATCPSKIVSIKQPAEKAKSWFDGVIAVNDIYPQLYNNVMELKDQFDESMVHQDFSFNSGWARLGSISKAAKVDNYLTVSGLTHVMRVFDDIENSKLKNVDFLEAMTCMLGCVGGPFNVESLYVAQANIVKQYKKYETAVEIDEEDVIRKLKQGYYYMENPVLPRPTKYFDTDLATSIKRMRERDRIVQKLPQIDCGCCGAPTCLAFAEDVVRGEAELTECVVLMRNSRRNPNNS